MPRGLNLFTAIIAMLFLVSVANSCLSEMESQNYRIQEDSVDFSQIETDTYKFINIYSGPLAEDKKVKRDVMIIFLIILTALFLILFSFIFFLKKRKVKR
jgi:hypothetical protein